VFVIPSGRAEFSLAPLPDDVDPGDGRLMLTTVRSHDQFNTTIYSNDDRYRGLKGLRTVVLMNEKDMRRPRPRRVRPRRCRELHEGRQ
jgi:anaerobic selenocysteine-containing dehydrogenase